MELKEQKGKVKINSHLETHGNYSIEWSYHFPLQPGLRVESELEIFFPKEKLPGAARHSLSEANLSNTRLSLADSASDVRTHAIKYLRDSRWLRKNLTRERRGAIINARVSEHAVSAFFMRAEEYWSQSFFSKTGLFLQSDMKQCTGALKSFVREEVDGKFDWQLFHREKRHLAACLRAALRLVETRLEWTKILEMTPLLARESHVRGANVDIDVKKYFDDVRELSEFSLILVSRTLAEVQGLLTETRARMEGKRDLEKARNRLEKEKLWLSKWVEITNDLRLKCKLKTLTEISHDPEAATHYFERMRELQRKHYEAWDLDLNLKPNESRYDFIIQGSAAAISALVAFSGLVVLTVFQGGGGLMPGEKGLIALGIFAVGNMVVYVLKDRLKDSLKQRFRKLFQSGRWRGNCNLTLPGEKGEVRVVEIAEMEREVWWSRVKDDWNFHIWEEFRVTPNARTTGARIIKQVWRLPLDEILHSLDDSQHFLKVPTTDGVPREVAVLKRTVFPYRLNVVVKGWKNKRMTVIDHEHAEGRIVSAGRRLFSIE